MTELEDFCEGMPSRMVKLIDTMVVKNFRTFGFIF